MRKLLAAGRALALLALLVYAGYWNPEVITLLSGSALA
jgi:hypothetical protein